MRLIILADLVAPMLSGSPSAIVGILTSAAITWAGIALLRNKGRRARQAGIVIAAALAVSIVIGGYIAALAGR